MKTNKNQTFYAYNTITGMWFVKGIGFVSESKYGGTALDGIQLAIVKSTYLNVAYQN
jgi:hypothetical protein